jgi:hypothetical protein
MQMESMKQIAKKKANEERKRLESEVNIATKFWILAWDVLWLFGFVLFRFFVCVRVDYVLLILCKHMYNIIILLILLCLR